MKGTPSAIAERARNAVVRYQADPVALSNEVLSTPLWPRQADIARSVALNSWTAVKSGHKIGKSTVASVLAMWWALTRPRGRAILVAPTEHQIKNILWPEIHRIFRLAKVPLGPEPNLDPRTGWRLSGGRGIIAVVPRTAEAMAGLSGPNQLFIVDEASGLDEVLWPAIKGNLAGGGRLLALGNPTQTSGTFFEAFTSARNLWNCLTVSSLEAIPYGIPGLATQSWVESCKADWGEDSPLFGIRVLGEFPKQAENAVIGISNVEAAIARWEAAPKAKSGCLSQGSGPLVLGVDVARFGDDESVVAVTRGPKVLELRNFQGLDNVSLAGQVVTIKRRWAAPAEVTTVRVDATGVGGGVVDQLHRRASDERLQVVPVHFGQRPKDTTHYVRARDEAWFAVRDWLAKEPLAAMPRDDKLAAELVAPTYSFDARGRIQVEPKDATKKRLRRSPDRADALALALYEPAVLTEARAEFYGFCERVL